MKSLNVLSLCDGMPCGHIALEQAGFKVNKYYASEIKSIAIKVTNENYPATIQIGDGWTVPVISHILVLWIFKKYLTFQAQYDILNNVRKINIIQLAKIPHHIGRCPQHRPLTKNNRYSDTHVGEKIGGNV